MSHLTTIATTHADTSVGRVLDGLEELIVIVLKGDGEGRINDPAVDLDSKVHLHDISGLED